MLELPGEVLLVGLHVEVAVPAVEEGDDLLLAGLAAPTGLFYRLVDGVPGLGPRDEPFVGGEGHRRLEHV